MIMAALQEEVRMPVQRGEGPVGIIICPSRELARQTFDIVEEYCAALRAGEWLGRCAYPAAVRLCCHPHPPQRLPSPPHTAPPPPYHPSPPLPPPPS